jgi:hypothetical protein
MTIGDVRPQDPSEQLKCHSPSDTTPPAQGHQDEHYDQVQEECSDQGGVEDDGEESNSRARPPHPRVRHNVQRDYLMNNILDDIEKGVTTRSHVTIFCGHY